MFFNKTKRQITTAVHQASEAKDDILAQAQTIKTEIVIQLKLVGKILTIILGVMILNLLVLTLAVLFLI